MNTIKIQPLIMMNCVLLSDWSEGADHMSSTAAVSILDDGLKSDAFTSAQVNTDNTE